MAEEDISGVTDDLVPDSETTGKQTGVESSLSSYAGPYVSDMLSTGQALADQEYEAYEDILTADEDQLQKDAFTGISALTIPTDEEMGVYTPKSITDTYLDTIIDPETGTETEVTKNIIDKYMNPFLSSVVDDQIAELKKQAESKRLANAARMTAAGSYGGSRQALQESLLDAKLLDDISQARNTGNMQAYEAAVKQFNLEQDKKAAAQDKETQYGFDVIDKLADLGGIRRDITQEGVEADIAQYEEEMNYPYKQVQFMQSLLQSLPLETQQYTYAEPSQLASVLSSTGGLMKLFDIIFGGGTEGGDAETNNQELIDLITDAVEKINAGDQADTEQSVTIEDPIIEETDEDIVSLAGGSP